MALVALGVSGGIGAYKAVEVARLFQKRGHEVVAILTRNARRFVGELTFEAITRRPVVTSQWEKGVNAKIEHIAIASEIALLAVAPATANVIGKMARGIADDFLSTLYLATRAPVLVAPAMNTVMWQHPAFQENLGTLRGRGVHVVEPGVGFLACGWEGQGRLAEPAEIVEAGCAIIERGTSLAGRRILVTAGPTFEDLDAVRFIGNRSSGRMGFAVAAEAARRGAEVSLIAGPTFLAAPPVASVIRVRSASEMHDAVMARAAGQSAIVMAAAVADYTPERAAQGKLAKRPGPMTLTLVRTADILAELGVSRAAGALGHGPGSGAPMLVGFAAETGDASAKAREKLTAKGVDLVVANDVGEPGAGFDVETNRVILVDPERDEPLPLMSKSEVAGAILDRVERWLNRG